MFGCHSLPLCSGAVSLWRRTASRPSVSSRRTRTSSPGRAVTFRPTKSARTGSSRPPRSTRTARRTRRGRPKATQRREGGADGPARVEDIVHQDDLPALAGEGQVRLLDLVPRSAPVQVVPVQGDVEGPHGGADFLGAPGCVPPAARPWEPPAAQPDQDQRAGVGGVLDDLVRQPAEGAPQLIPPHLLTLHGRPLPPPGWRKCGRKKTHSRGMGKGGEHPDCEFERRRSWRLPPWPSLGTALKVDDRTRLW